jgi:hypothetical protein
MLRYKMLINNRGLHFTVVENFFKILAKFINVWGAEYKTEFNLSIAYHFPKICIVNNFRYV